LFQQRVAQRGKVLEGGCKLCLHAGVRESLDVAFEIKEQIDSTVVFAQLVFPKKSGNNEVAYPLPVYVYSKLDNFHGVVEDYRVDTALVNENGHPNLVFSDGDFLKLQVTKSLRQYAAIVKSQPYTISFTLRLGVPMLLPKSLYFYNSDYSSEKVFSDRPAYSSYDFSSLFEEETVKLRLWYAKTDFN
jgi:hypothetical protein